MRGLLRLIVKSEIPCWMADIAIITRGPLIKANNLLSVVKMGKATFIKSELSIKIMALVGIRQFMRYRFYPWVVVYVMVLAFR